MIIVVMVIDAKFFIMGTHDAMKIFTPLITKWFAFSYFHDLFHKQKKIMKIRKKNYKEKIWLRYHWAENNKSV